MPVICCSMLVMGHLKKIIIKTHEIMFGIIPVNAKNLDCNNFLEEVVHYRSAEATRLLSMAAVCETFIPKRMSKRMSHKELAIMSPGFQKLGFAPWVKSPGDRHAFTMATRSLSNLSNVT